MCLMNLFYREEIEKRFLRYIENVFYLVEDDKFWLKFGCIFEKMYFGIKEILRDRIKDFEKFDCGIVVVGIVND